MGEEGVFFVVVITTRTVCMCTYTLMLKLAELSGEPSGLSSPAQAGPRSDSFCISPKAERPQPL